MANKVRMLSGAALDAVLLKAAMRAVTAAAEELEGDIKETLSTPGRGKFRKKELKRKGAGAYRIDPKTGKRKRIKRGAARVELGTRASAPGDPPAPDTGRLRNSVAYSIEKTGATEVTATVGPNVEYGRAQELGDPSNTWPNGTPAPVAPRPYLRPTLQRNRQKYEDIIIAEMGDALTEALDRMRQRGTL